MGVHVSYVQFLLLRLGNQHSDSLALSSDLGFGLAQSTESGDTNVSSGSHLSGLWGEDGEFRGEKKEHECTELAEMSNSPILRYSSIKWAIIIISLFS